MDESRPLVGEVTFHVPGPPHGKGRARAYRRGNFIGHYTPEKTRSYEAMVRFAAEEAMKDRARFEGAVSVQITAVFDIPASYSKSKRSAALANLLQPAKKPDLDNIVKAFCDGMNGIVIKDDAQIVRGTYAKVYGAKPMVVATVRPL